MCNPVRRLCNVAKKLAHRATTRGGAKLLERTIVRCSGPPGIAHRPSATGRADFSRSRGFFLSFEHVDEWFAVTLPDICSHTFHGADRCLRDVALAVQSPARCVYRNAGGRPHQNLPFEKLVDELQPERTLSYSPLFQAMFVFQNTPAEELDVHGLSVARIDAEEQNAQFDLNMRIEE